MKRERGTGAQLLSSDPVERAPPRTSRDSALGPRTSRTPYPCGRTVTRTECPSRTRTDGPPSHWRHTVDNVAAPASFNLASSFRASTVPGCRIPLCFLSKFAPTVRGRVRLGVEKKALTDAATVKQLLRAAAHSSGERQRPSGATGLLCSLSSLASSRPPTTQGPYKLCAVRARPPSNPVTPVSSKLGL